AVAVFSDPGRTGHALSSRCADTAPVLSKTKAPAGNTLEAQSHGLGTGCLRFAVAITSPHARLASGCWLGFTGWDWLPTESLRKVLKCIRYIFSSSPKLCLAQGRFTQVLLICAFDDEGDGLRKLFTYALLRRIGVSSFFPSVENNK